MKVVKNEGDILIIETQEGIRFTIKENSQGVAISAEPLTIICSKGDNLKEASILEDVHLNIRAGQSISKFYELDNLLGKEQDE